MDAPTDVRPMGDADDALAPMQAAPVGMPYTVVFPDGDGLAFADLEHPAHLPRVGDRVEYIDESGALHGYVVDRVIHTYQAGHGMRPAVTSRDYTPAALARPVDSRPEAPGRSGSIRAGLPQVLLRQASEADDAAPLEDGTP